MWPAGMSPVDRVFNVLSLGLTMGAGFLGVLEWFRLLEECSNPERAQPELYSCPDDERIFGTWVVIGLVVASGLASRYLLWRRWRALYVPLVALQLVAAGTIAWLATHHPNWGPLS